MINNKKNNIFLYIKYPANEALKAKFFEVILIKKNFEVTFGNEGFFFFDLSLS